MNVFDGFQLLSIVFFFLILVIKASYLLLVRKINPIAIGRGKTGWALAFELYAFGGLIVWILEIILRATHASFHVFPLSLDPQLIDSSVVKAVGVALVASALILFALGFLSFGNSWRVGLDTQTPGALVTSGTFAFTRNPIFVALDLWFVGMFLMNGTLVFLIFALLAMVILHVQMLREEKFLAGLYGEPYRDYVRRTARYFIW
jgi:protein-S-isoprenylcysteine O-methyltransferase Ste14